MHSGKNAALKTRSPAEFSLTGFCLLCCLLACHAVWHKSSHPRFPPAHIDWVPTDRHKSGKVHSHRCWGSKVTAVTFLSAEIVTRCVFYVSSSGDKNWDDCLTYLFYCVLKSYFSGAGTDFWKQLQLLWEWFSLQTTGPWFLSWNWGLSRLVLRSFR